MEHFDDKMEETQTSLTEIVKIDREQAQLLQAKRDEVAAAKAKLEKEAEAQRIQDLEDIQTAIDEKKIARRKFWTPILGTVIGAMLISLIMGIVGVGAAFVKNANHQTEMLKQIHASEKIKKELKEEDAK